MTASHGMTPAKEAYEALSVKADALPGLPSL